MRAALRFPWRSLPAKLVSSVFLTALVASLAVAWLSAQSIQSFLHDKIDRRLPSILQGADERLSSWYSQLELDLRTFAASATIRQNLDALRTRGPGGEVEQYLSYVLERFPQYRSLILLGSGGEPLFRVGDELNLTDELRARLTEAAESGAGDVVEIDGNRVQFVSATIADGDDHRLASLHGVVDLSQVEAVLGKIPLGKRGGVFVVGGSGQVLMSVPADAERTRYQRPRPLPGALPAVEVYDSEAGEAIVGSAVRFGRFGWTLAVEESYDQVSAPVAAVVREALIFDIAIALLCCVAVAQIARSIVKPIRELSDAALKVAAGEEGVAFPTDGTAEIGVLARAFSEMMERLRTNSIEIEENRIAIEDANSRLIKQNQELQRVNEVFLQLSITDDLTKLHNHRFIQEHLPREMKRSIRTGEPLCLILIDIDDFKQLNDRYGHSVGDAVLKRTAAVMNEVVREMDLLARYGGEEFALVASQTSLEGAQGLAEKIRLAVSHARFPVVTLDGPSEIRITVSMGVATFRGDEKAFFNDADRALYRAKDAGKDCVMTADEGAEGL